MLSILMDNASLIWMNFFLGENVLLGLKLLLMVFLIFNGLKCSTDVFSIVKSPIQSTLTTLSEEESCVDARMPFAKRGGCAFFDVAAFCQRYP